MGSTMESKHLMREVLVTALIMAGMMIYSHWTSAQGEQVAPLVAGEVKHEPASEPAPELTATMPEVPTGAEAPAIAPLVPEIPGAALAPEITAPAALPIVQTAPLVPTAPVAAALPGQDLTITNDLKNFNVKIGYTTPYGTTTDKEIISGSTETIKTAPAPQDSITLGIQTPGGHLRSSTKKITAIGKLDVNATFAGDLMKELEPAPTPEAPPVAPINPI